MPAESGMGPAKAIAEIAEDVTPVAHAPRNIDGMGTHSKSILSVTTVESDQRFQGTDENS